MVPRETLLAGILICPELTRPHGCNQLIFFSLLFMNSKGVLAKTLSQSLKVYSHNNSILFGNKFRSTAMQRLNNMALAVYETKSPFLEKLCYISFKTHDLRILVNRH